MTDTSGDEALQIEKTTIGGRGSRALAVGLALAALVALAACSAAAPQDEGVATLADPGTAPNNAAAAAAGAAPSKADEPKLREFVKCMRENGNPNMPDPKFTADGRLDLSGFLTGQLDISQKSFQEGFDACRDKLAGVNVGKQIDTNKMYDAAVTFTKCLRDHGFPQVKDPPREMFNGGGGGGGGQGGGGAPGPSMPQPGAGEGGLLGKDYIARLAGLDPKDPKVQAAMDACHPALVKSITQAVNGG